MIDEPVRVRTRQHGEHGTVATVPINHPVRLTSLDRTPLIAFVDAAQELGDEPVLRALIVTGEGGRAFMGGANLDKPASMDPPG